MKKQLAVLLIIITICIFSLTGCGSGSNLNDCEYNGDVVHSKYIDLLEVERGDCYVIYRDTETEVMYLCIGGYSAAMMTPILNSNGTPKLYEEK
jgi:uncharacterized lipoprotein YehR (DUF1307 family)